MGVLRRVGERQALCLRAQRLTSLRHISLKPCSSSLWLCFVPLVMRRYSRQAAPDCPPSCCTTKRAALCRNCGCLLPSSDLLDTAARSPQYSRAISYPRSLSHAPTAGRQPLPVRGLEIKGGLRFISAARLRRMAVTHIHVAAARFQNHVRGSNDLGDRRWAFSRVPPSETDGAI